MIHCSHVKKMNVNEHIPVVSCYQNYYKYFFILLQLLYTGIVLYGPSLTLQSGRHLEKYIHIKVVYYTVKFNKRSLNDLGLLNTGESILNKTPGGIYVGCCCLCKI